MHSQYYIARTHLIVILVSSKLGVGLDSKIMKGPVLTSLSHMAVLSSPDEYFQATEKFCQGALPRMILQANPFNYLVSDQELTATDERRRSSF